MLRVSLTKILITDAIDWNSIELLNACLSRRFNGFVSLQTNSSNYLTNNSIEYKVNQIYFGLALVCLTVILITSLTERTFLRPGL